MDAWSYRTAESSVFPWSGHLFPPDSWPDARAHFSVDIAILADSTFRHSDIRSSFALFPADRFLWCVLMPRPAAHHRLAFPISVSICVMLDLFGACPLSPVPHGLGCPVRLEYTHADRSIYNRSRMMCNPVQNQHIEKLSLEYWSNKKWSIFFFGWIIWAMNCLN